MKRFCIIVVIFLLTPFSTYALGAGLRVYHVGFNKIEGWGYETDLMPSVIAFRRTCNYFSKKRAKTSIGTKYFRLYIGDFHDSCRHIWTIKTNKQAKIFFEKYFRVYAVDMKPKVTGYFQVEMRGSKQHTSRYRYPVYLIPKHLVGSMCVLESKKSNAIKCKDRNVYRTLPKIYIEDIRDVNIVRLQGSGKIILPSGELIRVKYSHNYAYTRVENKTKPKGVLPKIRLWRAGYVEKKEPIIMVNMGRGRKDPTGAAGIELTPMGSVAVDPKYYPYGLPVWLDLRKLSKSRFRHMAVTQDTGSAIKGTGRVDFYWGTGHHAGVRAYNMTYHGFMYVFYPKISMKKDRKKHYERQGYRYMEEFRYIPARKTSEQKKSGNTQKPSKNKMAPCAGCIYFNQGETESLTQGLVQHFFSSAE